VINAKVRSNDSSLHAQNLIYSKWQYARIRSKDYQISSRHDCVLFILLQLQILPITFISPILPAIDVQ
jgi:hypothetical protein